MSSFLFSQLNTCAMLGWTHKSLTLKAKQKTKLKTLCDNSLIHLPFYLPTYLPT